MHPGPGLRIRSDVERPHPSTVAGLAEFDTPAISDAMNRLYAMGPRIRRLAGPAAPLAGPACTVKVFPGDNLMVHKALEVAAPGDVVVIDASASSTAAIGDLISTKARHRAIAGFVVDGLIRDLPGIRALGDFPVFASGSTSIGPLHRGPGEINFPVSAGGVAGNHHGSVVVRHDHVARAHHDAAAQLLERLRARAGADADYAASVARGEFSNAWVDAALDSAGLSPAAGEPKLPELT
jgi:regulator of RNase E activity RraA